MRSRLANVRLDDDRLRKARRLRERGVTLSDLVRDAIDARFEQQRKAAKPRDVSGILEAVFDEYPDQDRLPRRSYDVHDRQQARAAVRRRLRPKRR